MIPTNGRQPGGVREDVPAIAILATPLTVAFFSVAFSSVAFFSAAFLTVAFLTAAFLSAAFTGGACAAAETGAASASGVAAAKTAPALPRLSPDADAVERQTAALLDRLLPPRSDDTDDWSTGSACLHGPGEPRWITPCIPGPPCDPSRPPHPFDLVGVRGAPTAGPVYRGPCSGRVGSHDCGPAPRLHRVPDALFDRFYRPR